MGIDLSVITCTHNPKRDYLDRVIQSLRAQTLSSEQWEYLLIDNRSDQILASEIDLSWHPNACHIREDQLGLTSARLRGIRESKADVLVFVDDDNVLNAEYLESTLHISRSYPFIGVWGGKITGEFEVAPPDWTKLFWPYLGIRDLSQDKWSNLVNQYETAPCGAGICVKRAVAEAYANLVRQDPRRLKLGRYGQSLMSCEDSDLAFTACDQGLGMGLFISLKMQHLIPAERLRESYLLKLIEGNEFSRILLESFRQVPVVQPQTTWKERLIRNLRLARIDAREKRFRLAKRRGREQAFKVLRSEMLKK